MTHLPDAAAEPPETPEEGALSPHALAPRALPPVFWALAWVATLIMAAGLLLMGDARATPWAAVGALLLGAGAALGGWRMSRPAAAEALAAPPEAPPQALAASHAAAEELARLEALMGELPELGLLLDREGRAEVAFGRAPHGVSAEALHAGLSTLAEPGDRQALARALNQAWSGGHAEASFALAGMARRLRLSVRRGADGLVAILQEQPQPTAPPAAPDLREAVARAEQARDEAVAESAAKSRFLANMSHELRTPLNAILGFSDIMRTRLFGPLPDRYAEYAELIHESGRHLTDLINDLLDMSKIEADRYVLQTEPLDAAEVVSGALTLMRLQAEDKGVQLRGDLPATPLMVEADRRALKQIVLNLLSNAVKFTPPEGRVDVSLRPAAGAMELTVSDTGVGIAPEDLARLGKPYEQTEAGRRVQGTGLGLSLVKALTALHGGEFLLESRLGEGSAATVRLPGLIAETPAPEAAQPLI